MDEKDLDQLIKELYPSLLLYGISLTRSKSDAEELVQEAFYRFLLVYDKIENQNLIGWLFRVMRNHFFDKKREEKNKKKAQGKLAVFYQESVEDSLSIFLRKKEYESLYNALDSISNPYKEVLIFHYFLDMSIKEIADITGYKINNIKVILYRGRKMIKGVLNDEKLSRED
ncbi:RNA polymerase sigma factor [Enterococcus faecalis]|uniref:RNA polymerase sigma factor n=1 Tax=Enterococcus faecalis TaxID=1351 RepID=UPI00235E7E53|nr:RNA polymerase sigma factor [Enterococcus faecalis]WDA22624.1 RNA polymerase sigma factor [Enterococcus faecalis]